MHEKLEIDACRNLQQRKMMKPEGFEVTGH